MKMIFCKLVLLAACAVSTAAFAQTDAAPTEPGWTATVIKLQYARAEELAFLLQSIAPPGVTIVPYWPTNSLIISGDPAVIGGLTEGIGEKMLAESSSE